MSLLLQLTINGLITGSIYALVASGFSLIYGTNKFMHFAHGAIVTVSAYLFFALFSNFGSNFYTSIVLTLILSGLLGLFIYRVVYLQLQNRKASNATLLLSSIALLILFENLIQLFFGADAKTIDYIKVSGGMEILGAIITPLQCIIILISLVLLLGIYIFTKKTKLGRSMRAVASNRELASIRGVHYRRIADYSFIIGSLLAGVAGILIGLEQNLSPTMGTMLIIKGFTGAVIGGMAYVQASVLGSYLLGLLENYGIWFLPSEYKDGIVFVLLFIFLLFKPNGLFGINKGVKDD